MTFDMLHESICERDLNLLSQITEPNLREAFYDFFETLDEEDCEVQGVNVGTSSKTKIELIDFMQILGASIKYRRATEAQMGRTSSICL